ncbi:hypothetical protein I302_108042 [Kwoniella bestiolae CBS 10118]|uniref:L-serine ammonia-lyase n=1 Tax=Kwoniella bestiolae CBS 10118 TaxID=1296100 RepID=A0A1B9FWU5_9TREE|nr:hypothetical protein I302_07592 [Kwoniella bestiolae CBS 10118]OCF23238.1 hypothetical protein I302_07592 [Kwoniella bestiolae CBS 10118]
MPETSPQKPWIETPLLESASLSKINGCRVFLKLENLQPSRSFKSRGIGNFIVQAIKSNPSSTSPPHICISSGGNAGLAAATCCSTLGYKATVVVPLSTKQFMIEKLKIAGAEVIQHGETWFHADQHLRNDILSKDPGGVYVPPFDHPHVWDGASTLVPEWEKQLSHIDGKNGVEADGVVCCVGGGGLFAGIMQGLLEQQRKTKVIAVETKGAESLHASLEKGENVGIGGITSIATSLGAIKVCEQAFKYAHENRDLVKSVVVSDQQAVQALLRFASEENMIVEPACGATLSIAYEGRLKELIPDVKGDSRVVLVVCGGSAVTLDLLDEWRKTYVN